MQLSSSHLLYGLQISKWHQYFLRSRWFIFVLLHFLTSSTHSVKVLRISNSFLSRQELELKKEIVYCVVLRNINYRLAVFKLHSLIVEWTFISNFEWLIFYRKNGSGFFFSHSNDFVSIDNSRSNFWFILFMSTQYESLFVSKLMNSFFINIIWIFSENMKQFPNKSE